MNRRRNVSGSRKFRCTGAYSWCLVLLMMTGLVLVGGPRVSATLGSWADSEWVHGLASMRVARDCVTPGLYRTEGDGTFLGGTLVGTDLDNLASVAGIQALNSGASSTSVPARTAIAADTYANPLAVSALSAINLALGNGLQLGLPGGSAGAYNQWAQATSTGQSAGAAGLVNNTGAVGLTGTSADKNLPSAATLRLETLLPAVTALADAQLVIGAVASSAALDWCRTLENRVTKPSAPAVLTRNYGIARFDVLTSSPLITATRTNTATAVSAAATTINGLAGSGGLISSALTTAIRALITPALGILSIGATSATTTVTLDTAPVITLLSRTLTDGVVTINLAAGTVTVDLAAMLGGPDGLNGLSPNTQLVVNAAVANGVVSRTGALLDAWNTTVVAAMNAAIRSAHVVTVVNLNLTAVLLGSTVNVATVGVSLDATLGQVLDGTATLGVTTAVLPAAGVLTGTVSTLLNSILSGTLNTSGRAGLVATLASAITPVVSSTLTTLGASTAAATAPVVGLLSDVLSPLRSALSILVNVQPDQPNAPPSPTSLPDQFKVIAMHVSVLSGATTAANVNFATSWAGPDIEL